ncbi:MAG: hypothetical protein NTV43_11545 [Methylococcales bacterium]|nr:hypothetical protein [Methylococcales bacterium]
MGKGLNREYSKPLSRCGKVESGIYWYSAIAVERVNIETSGEANPEAVLGVVP